jgi:hypothetical protein
VIVDPPLQRFEGIAHGNERVFMGMIIVVVLVHDDIGTGQANFQRELVKPAAMAGALGPGMGRGNNDMQRGGTIGEPFQPLHPLMDPAFQRLARGHVAESNLHGNGHGILLSRCAQHTFSITPGMKMTPAYRESA